MVSLVINGLLITLGYLFTGCLFLAPIPTLKSIWDNGNLGDHTPVMYVGSLCNAMVWFGYGCVTKDKGAVLFINLLGLVCQFVYILFYLYMGRNNRRRTIIVVVCLIVVLVLMGYMFYAFSFYEPIDRSHAFGKAGKYFGLAMYAAPLLEMIWMVLTGNFDRMDGLVSLASLCNAGTWATFANVNNDDFVWFPNFWGIFIAVLQLALLAVCRWGDVYACVLSVYHGAHGVYEQLRGQELDQTVTE